MSFKIKSFFLAISLLVPSIVMGAPIDPSPWKEINAVSSPSTIATLSAVMGNVTGKLMKIGTSALGLSSKLGVIAGTQNPTKIEDGEKGALVCEEPINYTPSQPAKSGAAAVSQ